MTPVHLPRGAVMLDVAATVLTDEEKQRLLHPAVGGVIVFRRNFASVAQLTELVSAIKALRSPELIVAVDHEGGRVQRFLDGFTRLPAMANLGAYADRHGIAAACEMARATGCVLASELRACGVDLSFTPVLDVDYGQCAVIGNRSFHRDPQTIATLAIALQQGLRAGGMASCGKHFPGHGFVAGDSHTVLPCDARTFDEISAADLLPFRRMIDAGMASVMPAHVLYQNIDAQPAGFSAFWLQTVLREHMHFDGAIFSDDLTMEGACGAGGISERAAAALDAGCDIVLVCNRPDLADELLASFRQPENSALARRWQAVAGDGTAQDFARRIATTAFDDLRATVSALCSEQDVSCHAPKVGEAS
ncbi:MAG: beta-N-acetylhexosaminidase [Neisseria sp.]|nr:beta-N-acetylhexosaminidase [Neisseria sp.]